MGEEEIATRQLAEAGGREEGDERDRQQEAGSQRA